MNWDVEQAIAGHLDPGEQLLWSGAPARGVRIRRADWWVIPFSLMWTAFAVFWEVMAFRNTETYFFRLWGVPFVLVGAYLVVGRFLWDARRRGHTTYAVTDRRVLLVTGAGSRNTTTLPLRSLPAITLVERDDRSGDVVFDASDARHVAIGGLVPRGSSVPAMLEFVPNARQVYDVIREAQRNAV